MSIRRFLLLASSIALMGEVKMQGRKMTDYETYCREKNKKYAASKKKPLTKKQQKARDKSKRASKARNKLRRHPNYINNQKIKNKWKSKAD